MRSAPIMAMLFVTAATAQVGNYGESVGSTDGIFRNPLSSGGPSIFGYLDVSGNGVTDDDAFFIARSTTLAAGDVALNSNGGVGAGQQIPSGSNLVDQTLVELSGQLAFLDHDGGGSFSDGDTVVLDRDGAEAGFFSIGDLILSGDSSGRLVSASTSGVNAPATAAAANLRFLDLDGSGDYGEGDGVYIDMNQDNHVTVGDVRLTNHNGLSPGQRITLQSPDRAFLLRKDGAPTLFTYLDDNGDQLFTGEETAYLARSNSGIGSIRINESPRGEPGSSTTGGSADAARARLNLDGSLMELGNGDGRIEAGEVLVYHLTVSGGSVSGRDIVLSGPNAGKLVQETNLVGASGTVVSHNIGYLDLDGNGVFSLGDVAYYDGDNNGFVSVGDVQLSVAPAAPEPPADDTHTPTPTQTQTQTEAQTATDTQTDAGANPTEDPAIAAAWLLPSLLLAFLIRRRW